MSVVIVFIKLEWEGCNLLTNFKYIILVSMAATDWTFTPVNWIFHHKKKSSVCLIVLSFDHCVSTEEQISDYCKEWMAQTTYSFLFGFWACANSVNISTWVSI